MTTVLVGPIVALLGAGLEYSTKRHLLRGRRMALAIILVWSLIGVEVMGGVWVSSELLADPAACIAVALWSLYCGYLGHAVTTYAYEQVQALRWRRAWIQLQEQYVINEP